MSRNIFIPDEILESKLISYTRINIVPWLRHGAVSLFISEFISSDLIAPKVKVKIQLQTPQPRQGGNESKNSISEAERIDL